MSTRSDWFAKQLLPWFDAHRRDLPWRVARDAPAGALPPAYGVMVSEQMLQQTQVATVVPYFHRFMAAFPTIADLADANEQQVLRLWQGLGYYARARNLQKAAKKVVADFGGYVPRTVDELLTLPGVGRYTAGAVASIAFDAVAPILDGNVMRVLCRVDGIEDDPRDKSVQQSLWLRAEEILPKTRAGDFNQSLMELGATVCVPKKPACLLCPINARCQAYARGIQDRIPPPRKAVATPIERRWTICIASRDQYLIEQRPATGRWAGMWQFVTVVADEGSPDAKELSKALGLPLGEFDHLTSVKHSLTHRQYEFDAFIATTPATQETQPPRRWATLEAMEEMAFSKPQLEIRRRLLSRNVQPAIEPDTATDEVL